MSQFHRNSQEFTKKEKEPKRKKESRLLPFFLGEAEEREE
jgi:hypothetical protein